MTPFYVASLDIDTDTIRDKLFSLRDMWELRSAEYPFYTLGKTAYIDKHSEEYFDGVKKLNPVLLANFADLYETVLNYFERVLGEPVKLSTDLAYPGFHIFQSDKYFIEHAGNWHQDHPQITLGLDSTDNSTFTVTIMLPASGGGMDWIDAPKSMKHLAYKEKDITWHTGLSMHRIAGLKEYVEGEYRITLQGHLTRRNGMMEVYW